VRFTGHAGGSGVVQSAEGARDRLPTGCRSRDPADCRCWQSLHAEGDYCRACPTDPAGKSRYWDVIAIAAAALERSARTPCPISSRFFTMNPIWCVLRGLLRSHGWAMGQLFPHYSRPEEMRPVSRLPEAIDHAISMTKETAAKTGGISE